MNSEDLYRLAKFSEMVMQRPDQIKEHGKSVRGHGKGRNGAAPRPITSPQLEEAFAFIEDFVRLNPDKFLLDRLDDDNLLVIAEVMRVVAEDYHGMSCSQSNGVFIPHIQAAEALRTAALNQRKNIDYERDSDWND